MASFNALLLILLRTVSCHGSGRHLRSHQSTMKLSEEDADDMVENLGVDFTVPILLGKQRLNVVPDSGSMSLVVSSKLCPANVCPRQAFDAQTAAEYTTTGKATSQYYGSGKLWMQGSRAPFSFGPYDAKPQDFREITNMDPDMIKLWKLVKFDGILGLSWVERVPGTADHAGFMETTVSENFKVSSFSICISGRLNESVAYKEPSRFYWNHPAPLHDSASFTYVPVVGTDHWLVELSDFTVKFKDSEPTKAACWNQPCLAIVDTGTGTMSAPISDWRAIMHSIGSIDMECANFGSLPNVSFRLGGAAGLDVMLSPSMYVNYNYLPPIPKYPGDAGPKHQAKGSALCSNYIKPVDLSTAQGYAWILGRAFMHEFLVDFDRQGKRVGFARKERRSCPGKPEGSLLAASSGIVNMGVVERNTPARYPNLRSLLGDVSTSEPAYEPV